MRKKLLALLMCATMVLGSSAVAFAAPSADDYTAAEKVFTTNGGKITSEITTNGSDKKITMSAYVDGEGGATYGFVGSAGSYSAVRLDSDGDALEYLGTVDATGAVTGASVVNPSKVALAVISNLSTTLGKEALIPTGYKAATVVRSTIGSNETYSLVVSSVTATSTKDLTEANAGITSKIYPTNGDIEVNATTGKLTADVDFITADGYSYKKSGASLVKADGRATSSNGAKYYYTISKISSPTADQVKSVVMGIADGTITTNAAAVKVSLWQAYKDGNTLVLTSDVKPSSDVTIKLDNDVLSNTKLAKTTTSVYTISDTVAVDSEVGSYKLIAPIAGGQDVDFSKAYGTFEVTLPALTNDLVLIFDQGADASQNDGVASETTTTTAASETAASSPKTGDVAPIAALAVVMMGACGAMVVASKKRA
jgi:hypothetical protein